MPRWRSQNLRRKFLQHRRDFSRGFFRRSLATVEDYAESAEETVREGVHFTYTDRASGEPRVGFFDPLSQLLAVLSADEQWVVNHFPADDDYVRHLPDSDYP